MEFHNLKKDDEEEVMIGTLTKIFNNRISLLEKDLDESQERLIGSKILEDINKLDDDFFLVREKKAIVDKFKISKDLSNHTEELIEEVSPLTITLIGEDANISSFILKAEKLFSPVLDKDKERIQKIKKEITYMIKNVLDKDNLEQVNKNKAKLIKALQLEFWNDLTFDDVEFLVTEVAPTMKYFTSRPKEIIDTNVKDRINNEKEIIKEIPDDENFKLLLQTNSIAKKLKEGKCIRSNELLQLEKELSSLNPEITINKIQKETDFIIFLRKIFKITREKDPKKLIEERFTEHIIKNHNYNERQIEFLNTLKKVFAERKRIAIEDVFDDPFNPSNRSQFDNDELINIIKECNNIKMC
ncbi:MAG: hypothetical protein LBC39_01560 [Methanobrevibacter sp.]|nr:hypothetical protein [Candidatus Methanovirga aequatorialis]